MPEQRHLHACLIAGVIATISLLIAPPCRANAEQPPRTRPAPQHLCEAIGARSARLVRLDLPARAHGPLRLDLPLEGEDVPVRLTPVSLRADDFALLVRSDGSPAQAVTPPAPTTMRGVIEDRPGSGVAASLGESGLSGLIIDAGGNRTWIEPARTFSEEAEPLDHVIYRADDLVPDGATCGTSAPPALALAVARNGLVGGCGGDFCLAQIACDTDAEFGNLFGASTVARIESILNAVNLQYERDVGITYEITTIIVRDGALAADPYTATDPEDLLDEFEAEWNANQQAVERDLAQLFSGKDLDGSIVGFANLGSVCSATTGYSVVQHRDDFAKATDLSAHELGHNWGADHCACDGDQTTGYTMNASLTGANRFHPTFTIPGILDFRDLVACLDGVEAGTTSLPFSDDFDAQTPPDLDPALWTGVEGAETSTLGTSEPSPPNCMRLSGDDEARTARMDASTQTDIELSYEIQRGGNGSPPGPDDHLVVEFFNNTNCWIEVARHAGNSIADDQFSRADLPLPAAAEHAQLRVRFRAESSPAADWFIDDVSITSTTAPPGSATLAFPFNSQSFIPLDPTFSWTVSENTDTYHVLVDDAPSFASPVIDTTTTDNSLPTAPNTLAPATVHYWRVISQNAVASTNSTPVVASFTTIGSAPGSFGLIAPTGGQTVSTLTPVLEWEASDGAAEYRVLMDRFFDFNTPFVDQVIPAPGAVPTVTFQVPEGHLEDGEGYYWKIQAINVLGTTTGTPGTSSFNVALQNPACEGDVDGNGEVTINDVTFVIFRLGGSGEPGEVEGDADANGEVTINDVTFVIFRLGPCPEAG